MSNPAIPSMLTKKSKQTRKQLAKSPLAHRPTTSEELNLKIKIGPDEFIIQGGAIALSGLLSDWRRKNPEQNEIMLVANRHINQARLIRYIVQYMDMWAGYYAFCEYQIRLPIRTADVAQVLYSQDWRFLAAYIKAEVFVGETAGASHPMPAGASHPAIECGARLNAQTKAEIAALTQLLDQAAYLKIDSLEKKIYVYMAAMLYDKTAVDIEAWRAQSAARV
jgi:hypothetical protein